MSIWRLLRTWRISLVGRCWISVRIIVLWNCEFRELLLLLLLLLLLSGTEELTIGLQICETDQDRLFYEIDRAVWDLGVFEDWVDGSTAHADSGHSGRSREGCG